MRRMFSEKQIKKIIDEKNLREGVVAKNLIQTEANWELDIGSLLDVGTFKSHTMFTKFALYSNELLLILSGFFIQGADYSDANPMVINNQSIDIPDWLAEKIFRADGTNLNEDPTGSGTERYIVAQPYTRTTNATATQSFILYSSAKKKISLVLYSMGTRTEDTQYFIDLRTQLLIA